ECCEVEMEDPVDPIPISYIDEDNAENPLAVTEYVQDIYSMYRGRENIIFVPADYMWEQININERMRVILIDLLIELVGVTAMLLAFKYEELSIPVVDDFVQISDKAYSREEMLEM
ncbi:hypothetical protein KI387_015387, partial [Taxus chinensis]